MSRDCEEDSEAATALSSLRLPAGGATTVYPNHEAVLVREPGCTTGVRGHTSAVQGDQQGKVSVTESRYTK